MKVISSGMFITILVAMVSGFIGFLVGSSTNLTFRTLQQNPLLMRLWKKSSNHLRALKLIQQNTRN